MSDGVLTAGGGHQWENELVGALASPGSQLAVVRRCVDIAEVLAVAGTGQAAAVVLAADLRQLTSDVIQRLRSSGVAVIGVHPGDDPVGRQRLERIGVSMLVADDLGAEAVVDAIRTALAEFGSGDQGSSVSLADPRSALGANSSRASGMDATGPIELSAQTPRPPGRVIAVWGPTGAPGRTTIALNLAAELADQGMLTMLVDADTYGGVVSSALGLLDESPGLAGACRLAANGRLDATQLAALCWQVGPIRVLSGVARADRWPEVRPSAIPVVLTLARQQADVVVVDCGFAVETDEEISFDTAAPRRNGATLAVLEEAELVLAVGSCDPPGMERLVRGLAELQAVLPGVFPRVVLNRQRGSAAGVQESVGAVSRFTGSEVMAVIPEDREATDRAWRDGLPLSQAAPASRTRTAIAQLAKALAPRAPSGAVEATARPAGGRRGARAR